VVVNGEKRNWSSNRDFSNIYGLMPNFACCLANMHQGWPKFVETMWMATNDNGLMLTAYGPSSVKAIVGKGTEVEISEQTDYPFKGSVILTIKTPKPCRFPLHLRIPSWEKAKISWKGKSENATEGSTFIIKEKWQNGDQVIIEFPMKLRYETRFNNSVSLLRGPLYFSLRIEKEYKSVRLNYDNFGYKGSIDWEINPKSDWNYGLILNREDPGKGAIVTENAIGLFPFADAGDMIWSSDSSKYVEWTRDAAVVIRTRGMKIPGWTLKDNSADLPPQSPVKPEEDPVELVLVPYGSAKLRITEFPVMDMNYMSEIRKPE
jgi:hypothetical protein